MGGNKPFFQWALAVAFTFAGFASAQQNFRFWEAGKKYALIVGIEQYASPEIPSAKFADRDAEALGEVMRRHKAEQRPLRAFRGSALVLSKVEPGRFTLKVISDTGFVSLLCCGSRGSVLRI